MTQKVLLMVTILIVMGDLFGYRHNKYYYQASSIRQNAITVLACILLSKCKTWFWTPRVPVLCRVSIFTRLFALGSKGSRDVTRRARSADYGELLVSSVCHIVTRDAPDGAPRCAPWPECHFTNRIRWENCDHSPSVFVLVPYSVILDIVWHLYVFVLNMVAYR